MPARNSHPAERTAMLTTVKTTSPLAAPMPAPLTMSSREIAELVEKQHKHVIRDIQVMLEQIAEPNFGPSAFEGSYKDSTGRTLKEYRLPKDLTVTLITGYRADLRYRVVKRLEQLEQQKVEGGFQIPRTLGEALQLAADQAREIEGMRNDVAALGRVANADGSLCITDAAKALQMRPKDLFRFLQANGWIYQRPGTAGWLGYQSKTASALLEHKVTTVLRADGSEKVTEQVRVTPKGLTKLAKLIPGTVALVESRA
jgi:phage regulator Rha-like protein